MPDPAPAPVAPTTPRPSRRFVRWAAIIAAYMAVGTIITIGVAWGFAVRWQTPGRKVPVVEEREAYRHELGYLRLGRATGLGFENIDLLFFGWDCEDGMPTDPALLEAEKDRRWVWWRDRFGPFPGSKKPARAIPLLVALYPRPPGAGGLIRSSLSTGWPFPALSMHTAVIELERPSRFCFDGIRIGGILTRQLNIDLPMELRRGFAADAAFWSFLAFALVHGPKRVRSCIRTRHGRCGRCGYSVAGLTGTTCPECGSPTRHSLPTHSTPS